jgi:hypothetical protein
MESESRSEEFAGASEHAPLSDAEMETIHEMYVRGFDVTPYEEEVLSAES